MLKSNFPGSSLKNLHAEPCQWDQGRSIVLCNDKGVVASILYVDDDDTLEPHPFSREEDEANANAIIHAVRCHDDLVRALEAALPAVIYYDGERGHPTLLEATKAAITIANFPKALFHYTPDSDFNGEPDVDLA